MVITKLYGGLGNQMFQYAAGRALALRNNDILKLDLSWFGHTGRNTNRPFKLRVFNIEVMEPSREEVKRLVPSNWKKALGLYGHKMYIKEKGFAFDEKVASLSGDVYLDGYWQSERYFKDFEEEIRSAFTLREGMGSMAIVAADDIKRTSNSVSLHIRRGDYVEDSKTNAYHGTCSPDYYKRAIGYVENSMGEVKLFVFSDDIEWAKEQDLFKGAVFVSNTDIKDYEELIIMSMCRHNIIANSSFSWWGAWLNGNTNKIVVAPEKWFNVEKDTSDLIPQSWVRI